MVDLAFDPRSVGAVEAAPVEGNDLARDFRSQVRGGWDKVHPAIRARMDRLLTSPTPTVFKGRAQVRRSRIGWLIAQLARPLGAPLTWKQGEDVEIVVEVAPSAKGHRCWHRHFLFADGTRQVVQTTKVIDPTYGFIDAVGEEGERMLATPMAVWPEGRSLFFASKLYLLRIGGLALPIPLLLTPGRLLAEHRDEGNGWFRYILKFEHPLWGQTFLQDGLFKMVP